MYFCVAWKSSFPFPVATFPASSLTKPAHCCIIMNLVHAGSASIPLPTQLFTTRSDIDLLPNFSDIGMFMPGSSSHLRTLVILQYSTKSAESNSVTPNTDPDNAVVPPGTTFAESPLLNSCSMLMLAGSVLRSFTS